MIEVKGVTKSFDDFTALDNVTCNIAETISSTLFTGRLRKYMPTISNARHIVIITSLILLF